MLRPGTPAPAFEAISHLGRPVDLAALRGHWVLLYFYPRDASVNCTRQACSLRDHWDQLREAGVHVLGVSPDSDKHHRRFAERRRLPFPLISDPGRRIIDAYEARGLFNLTKRVSYLIDPDGMIRRAWHARRLRRDPAQVAQWVAQHGPTDDEVKAQ